MLVSSMKPPVHVCVRDVFSEVLSTRLVRQAHLYDRFPRTTSRLSCLRATVPAHGYKYDDSSRINQPLRCHSPTRALSGWGGAYNQWLTSTGTYTNTGALSHIVRKALYQYVFGFRQRQSASGSINQYTARCNKNKKQKSALTSQHQAATISNNQCTVRYNAKNKKCRSLPGKNTDPLCARFPTASPKLRNTKVPKPSTYRRHR